MIITNERRECETGNELIKVLREREREKDSYLVLGRDLEENAIPSESSNKTADNQSEDEWE